MTAPLLATREALAAHEPALGTFAGRPGIVGCSCLSARDYRAAGFRGGQAGWRDHLLASGVVRDPATLADDMKRLVTKWEAERHVHRHIAGAPSQIDAGIRVTLRACADDLRALAAALTEDPS